MPLFQLRLHRRVIEHRVMRIEARNADEAKARARSVIRHENGDADSGYIPSGDDERSGEWCDSDFGRAIVDRVVEIEGS